MPPKIVTVVTLASLITDIAGESQIIQHFELELEHECARYKEKKSNTRAVIVTFPLVASLVTGINEV